MTNDRLVIAAVDGSQRAQDAALWAADEAKLRGAALRVVEVVPDPDRGDTESAVLGYTAQRCRRVQPELSVREEIAHGNAVAELVRRSKEAELMVLGAHGHTATRWASVGSVATKVATHAECPVVVVREPRAVGGIVVGIDGSAAGQRALRFAFETARARGAELVAVRARDLERVEGFPVVPPMDFEIQAELDIARRHLDKYLQGWADEFPDVGVRREIRCGHPTAVLLHSAAGARMLVVGHRGRGGFAGLLLGSTAAGVLRDAPCPVAVLRGPEERFL